MLFLQGTSGPSSIVQRALVFVVKWSRALLATAAIYTVLLTMLLALLRHLPTRGALSEKANLPEVRTKHGACSAARGQLTAAQLRMACWVTVIGDITDAGYGAADEAAAQYHRAAGCAPYIGTVQVPPHSDACGSMIRKLAAFGRLLG